MRGQAALRKSYLTVRVKTGEKDVRRMRLLDSQKFSTFPQMRKSFVFERTAKWLYLAGIDDPGK